MTTVATALTLKIGGTAVAIEGISSSVFLLSLSFGYSGPAELHFRNTSFSNPYSPNTDVELSVGGVIRFAGRIMSRVPDLTTQSWEYVAKGPRRGALHVPMTSPDDGMPEYLIPEGTAASTVVAALFTGHTTKLAAEGAGTTYSGAPDTQLLPIELSGNFDDALQMLLQQLPGYAIFVTPATKQWQFIHVLSSAIQTLTIPTAFVSQIRISESIEDRYTAVVLVGPSDDATAIQTTSLAKGWDTALEGTWTVEKAGSEQNLADIQQYQEANVWRKWSFASVKTSVDRNSPVEVRQELKRGAVTLWTPLEIADIDWDNGFLWTRNPVTPIPPKEYQHLKYNTMIPGFFQGASVTLNMLYRKTILIGGYSVRIPETGYTGTATQYGVEREKIVRASGLEHLVAGYAQRVLDAYKDVLYEGSFTIPGLLEDVPSWLWGLDARVNIAATSATTGMENAAMIVSGWSHDFSSLQTTIEVSSDRGRYTGDV